MSRGLRNCNPGNIRHSSVDFEGEVSPAKDAEFKEFCTMAYGYRAVFVVLDTYSRRYNLDTIRAMIARYAPPEENFTEAYIRFITRRTGIAPEEPIDTRSARDMIPIVAAMSEIENGVAAVMADVEDGWDLFIASRKR